MKYLYPAVALALLVGCSNDNPTAPSQTPPTGVPVTLVFEDLPDRDSGWALFDSMRVLYDCTADMSDHRVVWVTELPDTVTWYVDTTTWYVFTATCQFWKQGLAGVTWYNWEWSLVDSGKALPDTIAVGPSI